MVAPRFCGIMNNVWISTDSFSQHPHVLGNSRPVMPMAPDVFGDFIFLEFGMLTMFAQVFGSGLLCNLKTVVLALYLYLV
jgi:hypothetical protein